MVGFEASVAGGIPIIKALKEGLSANRIESIRGIINGTSNYILTAMCQQKACFHEALSDAQQLGYAESDPTADIAGYDAGHKLTILAAIAFGVPLHCDACYTEELIHYQPLIWTMQKPSVITLNLWALLVASAIKLSCACTPR